MKRPHTMLVILFIVAVALGSVVVAFQAHTNNTPSGIVSFAPMSANSPGPADSQTPNSTTTSTVTIKNFGFGPAAIAISKGTTVTWTNDDSVTHTVTADSGTGPNSGDITPGGSYSYTFTTAGIYHYHCTIHTEMTGVVTVTN